MKKARVENWSELSDYDYVFNCTGLGAKWLCHDDNVVPIRGQVFKVRNLTVLNDGKHKTGWDKSTDIFAGESALD